MTALGLLANLLLVFAVLEQICTVLRTRSASDISKRSLGYIISGLSIFGFIGVSSGSHWVISTNFIVCAFLYTVLFYLVAKYQREYKMPTQKKHLQVFKGGKNIK